MNRLVTAPRTAYSAGTLPGAVRGLTCFHLTTAFEWSAATLLTLQKWALGREDTRGHSYWMGSGDLNFANLALELVFLTISLTPSLVLPDNSFKKHYSFSLSWNNIYWVWEMLEAACPPPVWAQEGAVLFGLSFPPLRAGPHRKQAPWKCTFLKPPLQPDISVLHPHWWLRSCISVTAHFEC